jgi:hypothetical protein
MNLPLEIKTGKITLEHTESRYLGGFDQQKGAKMFVVRTVIELFADGTATVRNFKTISGQVDKPNGNMDSNAGRWFWENAELLRITLSNGTILNYSISQTSGDQVVLNGQRFIMIHQKEII